MLKLAGVIDVFVDGTIVIHVKAPGELSEDSLRSLLKTEGVTLISVRKEPKFLI